MIKALTPVVVLLLSFAFRIEEPSLRLAVYIVLISSGGNAARTQTPLFRRVTTCRGTQTVVFVLPLHHRKTGVRVAAWAVTLSCAAQIEASVIGTLMQLADLVCEGLRLCFINLLLNRKGA